VPRARIVGPSHEPFFEYVMANSAYQGRAAAKAVFVSMIAVAAAMVGLALIAFFIAEV
jgi:hypothetical protein